MDAKPITLKLVVDTATNRIAFAESDKEFVDILLSFLTLPLGTVVHLLGKQSSLGSVDKLYGSVESFDVQFLKSEACRSMLLRPKNTAMFHCKKLRININDPESAKYYTCSSSSQFHNISFFRNVRCKCGEVMNSELLHLLHGSPDPDVQDGVFVKVARFAIADDLVIAPAWAITSFLQRLDIKDWSRLEERMVNIDRTKVLDLVKRSLISKTSLTDVFLQKEHQIGSLELKPRHTTPRPQSGQKTAARKITLKLVLNNKRLLYAQANHSFVDLMFSFLTFPMGSISKHLGAQSSLGCLNNLYVSANYLSSAGCLKKEFQQLLLDPKLPPYFSCRSQLIKIEEEQTCKYHINKDPIKNSTFCRCADPNMCGVYYPCSYSIARTLSLVDPRTSLPYQAVGEECYSRSSAMYMVTDELIVTPFSIISGLALHKGVIGTVEEIDIEIGEAEALALLRATLTSKTPLTDVFLS